MLAFADLLDRLVYATARNAKIVLIADYLKRTPDPDRGWALAALPDGLPGARPVRRVLAELMAERIDPELYRLSRDYVGDTAETVALLWPEPAVPTLSREPPPSLSDVVQALAASSPVTLSLQLSGWLDRLDPNGRWALLKLMTGAPRVGVSARLTKTAVAGLGPVEPDEIEGVWHGLSPPYLPLFAWLEGRAARPDVSGVPVFRPMMLAHPLEPADLASLVVGEYAPEWKWDGIRVQVVAVGGDVRLYARSGDDIGRSFPEIIAAFHGVEAVLDGELLVLRDGVVAPFNDLQQRLNRKTVSRRALAEFPAHVRLYDALEIAGEDLRPLALDHRRQRLEAWFAAAGPAGADLSPQIAVTTREELQALWSGARAGGIEGLMLKRRASPYLPGRPKGHWWKWKRAALTVDCVLMYAQRGSGKRSSFYSDYTFGVWRPAAADGVPELVPVGKAYSGFSDAELVELDRFIRNNTIDRFGPVRAVAPKLVLEVAFDAVQRSARHKSGVAMRFPRIHRIRWDKPAADADQLSGLQRLIGQ